MENQKQATEKPDMFRNFLPIGMLLGLGALIYEALAQDEGPYSTVIVLSGVGLLSITIPFLINKIKKRTAGQHIGAIASCLFGGLLFGSFGVIFTAMMLASDAGDTAQVESFARQDFSICDLDHDGVVTYAEIDTVIKRQGEVESAIFAIDQAAKALKDTGINTKAVQQTLAELDAQKSQLSLKILPVKTSSRMYVVSSELPQYGHIVTSPRPKRAYVTDYGATEQEMLQYRQTLMSRYHYWFVAFDFLHISYSPSNSH